MTADAQPIDVTLTVREWREIQAALDLRRGHVEPWAALYDALDEYDLTGDGCPDEDCSCTAKGGRS